MEISRGKIHVISPQGAFSVVLSQEASYYAAFGTGADTVINEEIWKNLNSQGLTNWSPYDRWRQDNSGNFHFAGPGQADSVVDMIYKIHKSRNTGGLADFSGYSTLSYYHSGITYLADTSNQIRIRYTDGVAGSGITVSFRGQLAQYLGVMGHEHGHYTFSPGHATYSRVSYGFGFDDFYSPSDMIFNRYMIPTNANLNSINYLGDYSSRSNGNGNILKVPIQGDEYFLLASRNKYSKWDRVMIGDSAQIDPYSDNSDKGKGLYIYHVPNGIQYPSNDTSLQDMECADGLFEWEYAGQAAQQTIHDCYISGSTVWPYFKKKNVLYSNDPSLLFNSNPYGDGISFHYVYNDSARSKWWGVGDQPSNSCNIGTDRLFTNDEEIYTRFDVGGDREDAWKPGFNEVFSPYSSPNTKTWANQNSGIFIWYYSYSGSGPGDVAYIKVYKAGENGETDSTILSKTPPSRPMGLYVLPCDSLPEINGYLRVKIRWNHNQEPDMKRTITGETDYFKRYKIYRSTAADMSQVPPDALQYPETVYDLITTVDLNENSAPYFIDSGLVSTCNDALCGATSCWEMYPVRYRVQAVDVYNDVSVLSDFVNTEAWNTGTGEGSYEGENFSNSSVSLSELPTEYSLKQNYPNPFNPNTNIQYDLPTDNFVSLKIYNVLGKEITTLINENKTAGRYIDSFNASKYPSGIYYYKIKAGSYEAIRKMMLIK